MQNFLTIFRRELGAYFNSPIGPIFLIVFTLIASGLFVAQFFLFPLAELRSFFGVLPIILSVFIPAVTMRLWAEERANNTVEMLLTFPMRPVTLVLGKFVAGLCFLLLALVSTLLLPLMITILGHPDFGQMASSYIGALLLGAFFLALGQLVSGFARDQIVAFVLSLLACFSVFLLGTDFAATALDSWINGLGVLLRELLGVTGHYMVFTRGVIAGADLAYFLVWIALFLFLNGLFIEGRGRKNFTLLFASITALCLGLGLTFNALIQNTSLARFDWSAGKIHTISAASGRILSHLKTPVHITYYVTPEAEMPTEIKTLERDVLDRLEELRRASGNNLSYTRVPMHAANILGSEVRMETKNDPLEKRMLEKGVEPFSVSAMRQTGSVSDLIYSSLGIACKGKPEEIIPQIVPDSLGDLEYTIVSTIYRLNQDKPPLVALLGGEEFSFLRQVLEQEKYTVRPVALSGTQALPADADVLLVCAPQDLNARQVWELRQALAAGQKTILLLQTNRWDYKLSQGRITVWRLPVQTGLEGMLRDLGVAVESKVLMDEQNAAIQIAPNSVQQALGGGLRLKLPIQIMLSKENMTTDDPLTTRLQNLFYFWGAALSPELQTLTKNGLTATVLASSSPRSWLADVQTELTQAAITPPTTGKHAFPVMLRLNGHFPMITDPAPPWPDSQNATIEKNLARPRGPGELLLIGSAVMFNDDFLETNIELLMNAVDSLAHSQDLIQIRGKKSVPRYISDLTPQTIGLWQLITYGLPSVVIAALALVRTWLRIRRRKRFALTLRSQP